MAEWEYRPVEELVSSVSSGGTPRVGDSRYYTESGVPFLKIDDITKSRGRFVDKAEQSITRRALEETAAKVFPAGTVLVTMYGTMGVIKTLRSPMATNQAIAALVPPFQCDPNYLALALSFRRAGLERLAAQTTQPNISGTIIRRFQIPVPRLDEQQRISEILDTVDETIQAIERVVSKQAKVRAGLAATLFPGGSEGVLSDEGKANGRQPTSILTRTAGRSAVRDVGFASVPFSEVADFINGYGFGPADWGKSGLPIIRIQQLLNPDVAADLYGGSLDSRYRIDTGDIVMSWSGTIAVVEWDRGPAWLNQHLFRVDAKAGVEAAFLKHLLNSRLRHLEAASHGTTMKHIKRGDLLKHEVLLPPLEEQRRIAAILDTIGDSIRANEQHCGKLRELRSGLAADLLSGKTRTMAA